ncbi:MAG: hypothetical protein GXX95_05560 [Methanomassiliicoccus sp.]|nr:hypothetical protein [Methanomassiliicoccus sp.]
MMNITFDEFLALARKYQSMGCSAQNLLDDIRHGTYRVQDGVRLKQLYEFLLEMQRIQDDQSDVQGIINTVANCLAEYQDEEEERIVAEKWVPEKGFPGATLWLQREDEKWTIAPSPKEGACLGKCVKDLGSTKWFERPLPLLVDQIR